MMKTRIRCSGIALLLMFFLLAALLPLTAESAQADSVGSYSVSCTTNGTTTTFTVTRTNTAAAETLRYRTVSISAFAGQHFISVNGTISFAANERSKTVDVTELTPESVYQYMAMPSTTESHRSYRFEVLDRDGFLLAYCDRNVAATTVVSYASSGNYNLKNERSAAFFSSLSNYTVGDGGYNANPKEYPSDHKYLDLPSTAFYDAGTQAYLYDTAAELRMTLRIEAAEINDGYQYVQVLTDNVSTYDSGAKNGDPGTIAVSRYMAGFEILHGTLYELSKVYTFPVLSAENGAGATNPWGHGTGYNLVKHKFNTRLNTRAADGKILLNTNFNTLVLRFDASGSDDDNWILYSAQAKITAVDTTAPAVLTGNIAVSPGPYNRGNDFYISVPFNEVLVNSNISLNTSWGTATLVDGDNTNVYTFKGTIDAPTGTTLSVTGMNGTPVDLFGNSFSGTVSKTFSNTVCTDPDYSISYNLAGGSMTSANPTSYKWSSAAFTLTNPTRAGYTFAGWTGTGLTGATQTVTVPTHSHGSRIYTANWTPTVYTVGYDLGGGSVSAANPATYTVESDAFTLNNPTRVGYTFAGWTGTDLTEPTTTVTVPHGSIGNRSYTANWTPIVYTVGYDLGGGSVSAANPSTYTVESDAFTLNNPTRVGYTFTGWTGTGLTEPTMTVTVPHGSIGNRSYTANWTLTDYTVTVAAGIEHGAVTADKTAGVHMGDTVTLTVSPDAGYAPDVLTVTDADGSPVTVTNNRFTMPASDVTVHATFITEWAWLNKQLAAGGTVTLQKDFTAAETDGYLLVPENVTVTLDLNGFTLDRNLTEAVADGYVIKVNGTLILNDSSASGTGVITGGNCSSYCGGVYVDCAGTFTMSGGSITNNTAESYGGGVFLTNSSSSKGSFTMTGGSITNNTAESYGGGVYVLGDSSSKGSFTMTGGSITNNTANYGGGLGSYGITDIKGGTISENTANNTGGGVYVGSGASFTMSGGTITNNTANNTGGGVYNYGTFELTGGTISGNTASNNYGGGVWSNGTFTMISGTITNNSAKQGGGGVYVRNGTFAQNGGTITGNTTSSHGGGVYNSGTFTMNGGVISENTAENGSGVYVNSNVTFKVSGSPVITGNTQGANGPANNVYLDSGVFITVAGALTEDALIGVKMFDSTGVFTSGLPNKGTAANFTADVSLYAVGLNADGEALLGRAYSITVNSFGSGTVTAPTSAVAGCPVTLTLTPDANCELVSFSVTDANGNPVEVTDGVFTMPARNVTVTASFAMTWASLQAALYEGGAITLTNDVTATAEDGFLFVPNDTTVTLDLNGFTIDRHLSEATDYGIVLWVNGTLILEDNSPDTTHSGTDVTGGIITGGNDTSNYGGGVYVSDGSFTMNGGTITGNTASNGGGVYVAQNGTFTLSGGTITNNTASNTGGGVYSNSTFTMTDGTISLNTAWGGGGVYNSMTFELNGGTISGNTATTYSGGGVWNRSTFTMNGGTITGNTATTYSGGGVSNNGTFTMNGGTISGNTTSRSDGGGVYNDYTFFMTDGEISGNTADIDGGGVFNNSTFTMIGGTITGNTANRRGGGVYEYMDQSTFSMSGGSITGNTASGYGGGVRVDGGTFNVSGSPVITGNTGDESTSNLYLYTGKVVTVTDALTEDANIGVSMETPGVFTSGLSEKGTAANFSSDDPAYAVYLTEDGEAALGTAYAVNIADGIEHGTISADPTAALAGAAVTLTVTPDAGYVLDTLTVTDENGDPVEVTDGVFTMPACDVTVTATFKELPKPKFTTHSLVLDGKIGVTFFMDLRGLTDEERVGTYMTFAISGAGSVSEEPIYFDEEQMNSDQLYFGFTCYVSSIQMADTITATYHYGDGLTVSHTYSIAQYIDSFDRISSQFDETTVALVHALADYGHYVQPFLSASHSWTLGPGDDQYAPMDAVYTTGYDVDAIKTAVADYAFARENNSADVEKIAYSVRLDSDTAILVYFKPTANYDGSFTVTLDGETYTATKQDDGRYLVEIPNIGAHLLGTTYTIVATTDNGTATVTVSALSYVRSILNSSAYADDATAKNAACAIYAYCAAAKTYKDAH